MCNGEKSSEGMLLDLGWLCSATMVHQAVTRGEGTLTLQAESTGQPGSCSNRRRHGPLPWRRQQRPPEPLSNWDAVLSASTQRQDPKGGELCRATAKSWETVVDAGPTVLTCKSFVRARHRGERLIEPSSSWFPLKFPSGSLESHHVSDWHGTSRIDASLLCGVEQRREVSGSQLLLSPSANCEEARQRLRCSHRAALVSARRTASNPAGSAEALIVPLSRNGMPPCGPLLVSSTGDAG